MTGTALAIPTSERRLGIVHTGKVDISKAKASLAARGSSTRMFPGLALNFKKGRWYFGFGKEKRQRVKDNTEFVMNLANTVETWQQWVGGRPVFAPLAYIILGEGRQPRDEMGSTDKSQWEVVEDDDGKERPMDPLQALTVCPIRKKGETELHHINLTSISSQIAFNGLLESWLDQYEANPGKLPIVKLCEAEERETKDKKSYLVPAFEIVGWEKASAVDNAGPGGIQVTDDEADELEEEPAPRKAATKTTKPAGRKAVEAVEAVEEVEEIEEEEEAEAAPAPRHDPRTGNGFSTRRAKEPEEVEADEDDEDEDDKPKMVRRSAAPVVAVKSVKRSAAPVVAVKSTKRPVVEEEDEPAPTNIRKRRAALN